MLQIGLGTSASPRPHSDQPSLFLDDDGYYWFLHPLFEQLAKETGQYIDLYGNAYFEGASLDALLEVLIQARQQIESQPTTWPVSVSIQIWPEYKEIFEDVNKAIFLERLNQWENLVVLARQQNLAIVCQGD
ncbi:hypothetical protein [Armatimonas rosea]|uniref:Uncharacterized protein n=1 Tax=Armatimonas rosea TaxID=685828 RepID=A0A7W9SMJ7_ARMRO|nr:hypothetical protein [Armatimonas rosea]MBB6049386.1 hypothetical protein [Armatimonas rosea]